MLERAARAAPSTRLYLTVGSKEAVLLGPNRALSAQLRKSRLQHSYTEFDGGHDMACWRGFWTDGIRELLERR